MPTCKLCNAEFVNLSQMRRHEQWHNPLINFKSKNRIVNYSIDNIWLND